MSARNGRHTFSQRRRQAPSISWHWTAVLIIVFALVFGVRSIFFPAPHTDSVSEDVFEEHSFLLTDEWFNTQRQAIQDKDAQIKESREKLLRLEQDAGPRETWDFQDRLLWSPLNSDIGNLEAVRESMVADYNGRARLKNRDPFKTDTIPLRATHVTTE